MGMQNNINNNLNQIAQLACMTKICQTLENIGWSSIDELNSKIRDLEIEIAKAKDYHQETSNMEKLLSDYKNIKTEYYKDLEEQEEQKKEKEGRFTAIFLWIVIFGGIISAAIVSIFL